VWGDGPHLRWWVPAVALAVIVVAANAAGWAYTRGQASGSKLPGIAIIRPPHEVRALALDGHTLLAGGRDGVFAIDRHTFAVTQPLDSQRLGLGQVRGLLLDRDRTLWIAHDRGLTRAKGSSARTFTTADGLPSNSVQCLLQAHDGRLWVGTASGAAVMDGERFSAITSKDGLIDDMVNAMAEDRDGGLWFGSYVAPRGGISVLRNQTWYRFALKDRLPHANVTCFLLAADGSMWVGTGFDTRGGAVHFEVPPTGAPRIVGTLSKADGLAGDKVRALYQDSLGRIWFASELDGIAVQTGAGFRIVTAAQGLSDNETKVIVGASDGTVWLGTRDGISYIHDPRVVTAR